MSYLGDESRAEDFVEMIRALLDVGGQYNSALAASRQKSLR